MSELKEVMNVMQVSGERKPSGYYKKTEVDAAISELEESHKKEVGQLLIEIAGLKADYKEACDRLQTANLIKDEQKAKADKLLSCLKYLVMRDLIKDCPPKETATEIVKEYDNGLAEKFKEAK
jgi:hypothetical protein